MMARSNLLGFRQRPSARSDRLFRHPHGDPGIQLLRSERCAAVPTKCYLAPSYSINGISSTCAPCCEYLQSSNVRFIVRYQICFYALVGFLRHGICIYLGLKNNLFCFSLMNCWKDSGHISPFTCIKLPLPLPVVEPVGS